MASRGSSGGTVRPGPSWTPPRRSSRSRGSQSGPPSSFASPTRPPARRFGHSRMMKGIDQQRLQQLRQGPGVHHEHREVSGAQGDRPHRHHRAGIQRVQDIQREESETTSKTKEKGKLCKIRKERGPPSTYLDNRSGKVRKGQERSGKVRKGQKRSGKVRKGQERSGKASKVNCIYGTYAFLFIMY
jgi:hypothetical protein